MALEAIYESQDDIPAEYRDLYSERGGKFELTGINGVKTQADVDRLNEALRKEKSDHSTVKAQLRAWDGLDPEDTRAQLDEIPALRAAADGNVDDEKLQKLVDAKVATVLAPVERENKRLKDENTEQAGRIEIYERSDRNRKIDDAVRKAATDQKIVTTALEDCLMRGRSIFEVRDDDGAIVTKDSVGVTPGIEPAAWLSEIQDRVPHWYPPSEGGGGGGGGGPGAGFAGKNPFTHEHWNVTEQGRILREHGAEKAEYLAKQAGTSVGGRKPAPKSK